MSDITPTCKDLNLNLCFNCNGSASQIYCLVSYQYRLIKTYLIDNNIKDLFVRYITYASLSEEDIMFFRATIQKFFPDHLLLFDKIMILK